MRAICFLVAFCTLSGTGFCNPFLPLLSGSQVSPAGDACIEEDSLGSDGTNTRSVSKHANSTYVGFGFIAGDWSDITKIQINAYEDGDISAKTYTLSIETNNAGAPSGSELGSCTFSGSSVSDGYVGCTLASAISFTPSTTYHIILTSGSADNVQWIEVRYKDDNNTPDIFTSTDGSAWTASVYNITMRAKFFSGAECTGN
jgi:hypothetical protein